VPVGLDVLVVDMSLVVKVFWWWARAWRSGCSGGGHVQQGAGPLSFYILWVPVS